MPTAHVGRDSSWDERFGSTAPLLDWRALPELSAAGVTVGAHRRTHRPMSALPAHQLSVEAAWSRAELEDRLGQLVTAVAYPYGRHDDVVTHLHGACGYVHWVTTRPALSSLKDRALELPRVEMTGEDDIAALVRELDLGC